MQSKFRKIQLFTGACLAAAVLWCHSAFSRLPNRVEEGPRTVALKYQPYSLGGSSGGPFRVVGAWRLLAEDARFGGISALAIHRGDLLAVTDAGVVARFPKPTSAGAVMRLSELPAGPGSPHYKVNRDSEALAEDPLGRGWWVAFENRDELWLYDPSFARALTHRRISSRALGRNRGIEGMIADGGDLLLFAEQAGQAMSTNGAAAALKGVSGWISEATQLPDGRILIANRRPTPIGLSNSLVILDRDGADYRATERWRVPVGRLDNVEALAAEPMPGGGALIWMMTDNNLQQRRPTLLIAVELRPRPAR